MKKILFLFAMLMMMSVPTFADDVSAIEKVSDQKSTELQSITDKYDFTVNYERVESCLELYPYQIEYFEQFFDMFKHDMIQASAKSDAYDQKNIVRKSVDKNLRLMRTILEYGQYKKYVLLINTTLINRGLKV